MDLTRRDVLKYCSTGAITMLAGCNSTEEIELGVDEELQAEDGDFNSPDGKTAIVEEKIHGKNMVFKNLDYKVENGTYHLQIEFFDDATDYATTYRAFETNKYLKEQTPIPPSRTAIIPFEKTKHGAEIQVVAYDENDDVVVALVGTLFQTTDTT